jgi:hypothetical protein
LKTGNIFKTKTANLVLKRIMSCAGTGLYCPRSLHVYNKFLEEIEKRGLKVIVRLGDGRAGIQRKKISCFRKRLQGFCQMGPLGNDSAGKR